MRVQLFVQARERLALQRLLASRRFSDEHMVVFLSALLTRRGVVPPSLLEGARDVLIIVLLQMAPHVFHVYLLASGSVRHLSTANGKALL